MSKQTKSDRKVVANALNLHGPFKIEGRWELEYTDFNYALRRNQITDKVFKDLTTPVEIDGVKQVPWKVPGCHAILLADPDSPDVVVEVRLKRKSSPREMAAAVRGQKSPEEARSVYLNSQDSVETNDEVDDAGEVSTQRHVSVAEYNGKPPVIAFNGLNINPTQEKALIDHVNARGGAIEQGEEFLGFIVDSVTQGRSFRSVNFARK